MSGWMTGMGNHLWQTTAFAVVVWGLTLLLRKNQARVRYGLWVAASVKFLVPFSLLIALGGMLPRPQRMVAVPAVYSTMDEVALPFDQSVVVDPTHAAIEPRHEWGTRLVSAIPAGLGVVWVCGVMVVLAGWGGRWRRVWRTLRRAELVEGGREYELMRRMAEKVRVRGRVGLRLSRELMEPGIFGIFRPVLIWPEQLSARLDDEHIAAILLHELEHVRRRDNLMAALHMFVEALFWFHPAVWWMERRLVEERERACDEAVVAMGSRPGVYAESLLKAVRFCVESPLTCVAGITGADLSKRVRGIMTLRLERLGVGRRTMLAIFGIAAFTVPIVLGQGNGAQRLEQLAIKAAPRSLQSGANEMSAAAQPESGAGTSTRQTVATSPGATIDPCTVRPGAQFDVVSIRQSKARPGESNSDATEDGVNWSGSLRNLIEEAYGFRDFQISGGPDWMITQTFDIKAKFQPDETTGSLNGRKDGDLWSQRYQSLLLDRFLFHCHMTTQELPVYDLVVAKGGTKAKRSATAESNESTSDIGDHADASGIHATGKSVTMDALARMLARNLGTTVVNKTGLPGNYDFAFDWMPEKKRAAQEAAGGVPLPDLPDALEEQVGLKLVSSKGPVPVMVVDHVERPELEGAETLTTPSARLLNVALSHSADAAPAAFEVATVKPANPKESVIGMFTYPGGRIKCTRCTLHYLTEEAFGLQAWQVSGGPDWMSEAQFDVEAKPSADSAASKLDNPSIKTPPTPEQREMLQSLLSDRFQMKFHRESKEGSVYILSRGDKPLKLQPPKDDHAFSWAGSVDGGGIGSTTGMAGTNVSMAQLATRLSGFLKLLVVDQTGLSGSYDFEYRTGYDDANADTTSAVLASMQGIGLKLKSGKGPVEVLVIDHAEMPAPN